MEGFMEDFGIFVNYILQGLNLIYNWIMGTIIGKILIFSIIISIFIYIIYKLVGIGE